MFTIRKLDDRVVFDGAAVTDLLHHGQNDPGDHQQPDLSSEAHDHGGHDATHQDHHIPDILAVVPVIEDVAQDAVHVLVVADDVQDMDDLVAAANDAVVVVTYDPDDTSLEVLSAKIQEALGGREAETIAFAANHAQTGTLELVDGQSISFDTMMTDAAVTDFWQDIGDMLTEDGRIDLLTCNLAGNAEGQALITDIENVTGHNVAASTDVTGAQSQGGDFILETDHIDVSDTYFDAERLEAYDGALATNQAPVNSVPVAGQSTPEDTPLTFSFANGNQISISDPDAGSNPLQVVLTANNGIISLSGTTGLTFQIGDGSSDGIMVFTGSTTAINNALDGLIFTPDTDFNGTASLTIDTNDQGYSGTGGAQSDTDTVNITVNSVNDAPVATDDTYSIIKDGSLSDSVVTNDSDLHSGAPSENNTPLTVQLVGDVTNGILVLNADGSFTYTPDAGWTGTDTFTYQTLDSLGGTSGVATATITVADPNEAPVNTVPGAQSVNEDGTLTFIGGSLISITDPDAAGDPVEVTLTVANGTLTLSQTTNLTFSTGDGTSDSTMTFTGTTADINAALSGMTYSPTANWNGTDTLTITTNDQGNNGYGGPQVDSDSVSITVNAVNDAPVNTVPGVQNINEDSTLTFSFGTGNQISVSDDASIAGGTIQVTVSVTSGTLDAASGSGSTITNDGTASVTIEGTVSQVNNALNGLVYNPTANWNGTATLTVATSDLGSYGSGGTLTDSSNVTINVAAVNDPPVNSVPGTQTINESTTLTFTGASLISISDDDAGGNTVQVDLTVANGTLTLSQTTGLGFTAGDGSADAAMTFTGTIADINAALDGMTYTPTGAWTGTENLTITTSDLGNSPAPAETDTDTVTINVQSINDPPVNSVPGPQTTTEDTPLTFDNTGNLISVTDPDAGTNPILVTVSVNNGTLTMNGGSGASVTNDSSATVTLIGTVSQINTALDGMDYIPSADFNGNDTLTITTNDMGATGTGGAQIDTNTVAITVTAVNDAPVNTVPAPQTTDEDTALVFSGANSNQISVADDASEGPSSIQVTLTVTQGTLTLSQTTGIGFTAGDGTADATMTFTGTVADVNAALNGLTYMPGTNYAGADTLTISTSDQGFTGGGILTDTDIVDITVAPVNEAPVNSVPAGPVSVNEDGLLTFAGGNLISISDIDGSSAQVTLSVTNGTLTLFQTTGLTFSAGDGTSDITMTFTGTITAINAALDSMTYSPAADFNGSDTLTITTSDLGNTGSGGAQTDTDTVAITVNPTNDAPINTLPGNQTTDENTVLTFSSGTGNPISISDDASESGSNIQVIVTVINGTIDVAGTSGAGVTNNGSSSVTIIGTVVQVNSELNGLTYTPTADWSGTDTMTVSSNDLGETGGGILLDLDSLSITVNTVNDAPVNTVPGAQTTTEDTPLVFTAGTASEISVSDSDAGSNNIQVTLSVTNGTVTVGASSGAAVSGNNSTAVTLTGTVTQINNELDGLIYTPVADWNGTDTLTVTTDDNGNTGPNGPLTDIDTVDITVNAVNDAPLNNVPGAQTTNEDTALVFSTGGGNAISISDDAGSNPIRVTLSAGDGVITLAQTTGLTFTIGDGAADSIVMFTGTIANINAALDGLSFTPDADFNGGTSLQITTNDLGQTGGGPLSATDTINITVNSVNDAPVAVNDTYTGYEDLVLTGSVSVLDNDDDAHNGTANEDNTPLTAQLISDVSNGTLILNADGTFTYTPTAGWSGTDSFTYQAVDTLGGISNIATVTLNVNAVNDPPVNTIPGAQNTNEDTPLIFSTGGGNGISVTDDASESGANIEVTLTAGNGTVTAVTGTGAIIANNGTGTVTVTGTVTQVNNALDGLVYTPNADYIGADSLSVSTSDLGNNGTGGIQIDADTVSITVASVNDAPVNTLPSPQSTNEDMPLTIAGISVSDAEAATVQVTLAVTNGTLSLSQTTGLTFTTGDGTADATMTFSGTQANVNAALNNLMYTPQAGWSGSDSLSITTSDLGASGSGGILTDTDTLAITVNSVNDAPVITVPGLQATNEDTSLAITGLSVSDPDVGGGTLQVTVAVTNGTLTLSQNTGLTFTAGDGTADASMTFIGTQANINAALNNMQYTPTANFNGTATVSVTANDQGFSGSGGAQTDNDSFNITVNAINDAPVNSVPGPQSVDEDTALVFSSANGNLISISDTDAVGALQVALTATNGTLTLSQTTGLTFSVGDGTDDAALTFTGTLADINAALAGMSFTGTADYNGPASLSVSTSDQGSFGAGGPQIDTDTVNITINAVNDAPLNSVPAGPLSVNEDAVLTFSGGNLISISDTDAGGSALQVTLTAANGTLTLSQTTNLTFSAGDGTADAAMTFTGNLTDINAALANMQFTPTADHNGPASVTITTSDQGATGSGGTQTDTDTVNITVDPVDDAPVNTVPLAQTTDEDVPLVFSSANGNQISIADDASENSLPVEVTVSVTNGTLTLAQTTGLTFTAGDGTADASMTFTGTVADINAALNGLTYATPADWNGSDTLTIVTNDQGNYGSGGPFSDTDTVAITVSQVNDAPVNTVPAGPLSVDEDNALTFSGGNLISVSDTDLGIGTLEVTLTAANGSLTLSQTTGLVFSAGDGTADGTMTFTGTEAAINAALNGMQFTPTADYNGAASVTITTSDQGFTGSGGTLTDTDTVNITVNAVNDAPVNTVPGPITIDEDTVLTFTGGNLIAVSDIDAGAGPVQINLTAVNGTLTLSQTTGLTFSAGDGTDDAAMTFTGTVTAVNAALDSMQFTPASDYVGAASVTIATDDQGNDGIGGPLTDSSTVNITVNAVNDAPVNTVPGPQSIDEDTALTFTGGTAITVSDTDLGANELVVTLTAANGTLTLSQTTGLNITVGDGTDDAAMTFSGSIADINTALDGMVFTPTADFNGPASVTIATSDQGFTGSGGIQIDTDTVDITVNAVNDGPSNTVPAGPLAVDEDTALTFTGGNLISVSDPDAGTSPLQITLSAANGTLTLSQTTGLTFTAGDGTADGAMTFTGSIADINAALDGMQFTGTANYNGNASVTISTSDQGYTGSGGTLTDTDTVNITVNAVNDPPVNTVPGPQSTNEDTALIFSSGTSNPISIADDASEGPSSIEVTVSVTNGTLTLAQTAGLTFSAGDGTADVTMTFTGTVADINAALDGLTYTPTADFNGAAVLTLASDDQGFTGGGAQTDTDTVNITVNMVNDAPVNTVPGAQSISEDTPLTFTAGTATEMSIADTDAGAGALQVTLTAAGGTLTLAQTTGLTFSVGDGTSDAFLTFTGALADINAALDGMQFTPTSNFNGAGSVTLTTNDQGNTGGAPQSDSDTVAITITPVNDAPINSVPGAQTVDEDTNLVFNAANSNLISISDDASEDGSVIEVTLGVTNGTLTLSQTAGLTFTAGDGTADAAMTFTGKVVDINAALNGLFYTPTADYNGPAVLTVTTDDQGNRGGGGGLVDTDNIAIAVNQVNDAPINTVPGIQTTPEDTALTFTGGNLISVSDTDLGIGTLEVTLTASNGTLTLSQTTNLSFTTGDGTADANMTFTGTEADINAALDGMQFTPTANFNGTANVIITTNDQGSTGSGGPKSDTDTVTINVTAANDAPVNTVPGPLVTNEDTALIFTGGGAITIADIDAGSNPVQVTLAAANGTLSLSQTSGLTFSTGDGTADATMTFIGTIADINAALNNMEFMPAADYYGAASVTITTDDQGYTGTGGAQTATDTVNITVNPVNDAPVNTVPGSLHTNIDVPFTFSGADQISVSDVDAATVEVTLSVTNGTITLSQVTNLVFTAGDGTDDATMTFTGTVADVNAALNNLVYTPALGWNGTETLTIITDDQGSFGAGVSLSDTDTVTIVVSNANQPPVNTVPADQTIDEDNTLTFTAGTATEISIADVDAGGGTIQVTLEVTNGILTASGGSGATVTDDGTALVTISGTLAQVNAALDGLVYAPTSDYYGADTLTITTDDQGNTGTGGPLTDTDSLNITINPINDAPVNTVPAAQTTDEDTALTFSTGNGNLISIADSDADPGTVSVQVSVTNGSLTTAAGSGATITNDGTAAVTIDGTVAQVNAALDGLVYTPTAEWSGGDTLTIDTSDLGNTGTGGVLTDSDTVAITVNPINDAPVNSVPGAQTMDEDTTLTFSTAGGNLISVTDADVGGGNMQVTLDVANGTLTVGNSSGATVTANGTASVTLTGTLTQINTELDGLVYTPTAGWNGADTLSITTDDQGNTGGGGSLSDADAIDITVNAVNDAPVNTVPGDQSIDEDTSLTFSTGNGNLISVTDDAAEDGSAIQVTLSVTNGVLTVASGSGATITADGTASVIIEGTVSEVNAALDGLVYTPTANWNGGDTLTVATDDQGNTGSGGVLTDTDTVAITVNAINDAPVNTLPGGQTIDEDTTLTFDTTGGNAITVSDVDAGSGNIQVTLEVDNGTLSVASGSGASVTNDGTATVTLSGTVAEVNAALDGLIYTPSANWFGTETLTITTDDQGNTGSGGDQTTAGTVSITVNPVNDPPVLSGLDNTPTFTENGSAVLLDTNVTVSDADLDMLNNGDGDYDGATLVIERGDGADVEDVLDIQTGGDISVSSGNISSGGVIIATYSNSGGSLAISFTHDNGAAPTTALVNEILQAVTYSNTNDNPPESVDLQYTFDDGSGEADGKISDTISVDIIAVNDAPIFDHLDAEPVYVENAEPIVLNPDATVNDPELDVLNDGQGDYDGTVLTISREDGADAQDVFAIGESSGFTVSGDQIQVDGVTIATFESQDGEITITFTSDNGTIPTTALVNEVLQSITYENTSDVPPPSVNLIYAMDDGAEDVNAVGTGTLTLAITPVNDAPVLSGLDTPLVFIQEGDPVPLDPGAGISDIELDYLNDGAGDYDGATLTIGRFGGTSDEDVFAIQSGGNLSVTDGQISSGGAVIATYTLEGGTLTIDFTSENGVVATTALVNEVLQSVTYENTSADPPDGMSVQVTFDDGSGADNATDSARLDVTIVPVNAPPVFHGLDNTPVFTEGGDPVLLDDNATISDFELDGLNDEDGDYGGAVLTIEREDGADAQDLFGIAESDKLTIQDGEILYKDSVIATYTSEGGTLTITFVSDDGQIATTDRVNDVLQSITYANSGDAPPQSVDLIYRMDDGSGQDTAVGSAGLSVNIVEVNDPPQISGLDDVPVFTEGGTPVVLSDSVMISDPEQDALNDGLGDYDGVVITIARPDGANPEDAFFIQTGGEIVADGANISTGGAVIGTYTNDGGQITITFTSDNGQIATTQLVNAVLQAVTYANTNSMPADQVVLEYTVNDTQAQTSAPLTVNIVPVNDAPAFVNLDGAVTYVENGEPVILDGDAGITDPNLDALNGGLGDYSGTTVTVARPGETALDDMFGIAQDSHVTTDGDAIYVDGEMIATFTSQDGVLTIHFTDSGGSVPTTAMVDDVLQHITYATADDTPSGSVRLEFTFDDGSGADNGQTHGDVSVTLVPANDPPHFSGLDQTGVFLEGGDPVLLNPEAQILDPEMAQLNGGLGDYDGLVVSLERLDGADAEDVLGIGGDGSISVQDGQILAQGNVIATFSAENGSLIINFTSQNGTIVTTDLVNAVMDNITYANTSINPPSQVTLIYTADDGSGTDNAQGTGLVVVTLEGVNAPPELGGLDAEPVFIENGDPVVLDPDVFVSDMELDALNQGQGDYNQTTLTLMRPDGADASDVFGVLDRGYLDVAGDAVFYQDVQIATIVSQDGVLEVRFESADGSPITTEMVNTVLQAVTYENVSDGPPDQVVLQYTFNDGSGAENAAAVGDITVSIETTNDPPVFDLNTPPVFTEGGGGVVIAPEGSVHDPELDALNGGQGDYDGAILSIALEQGPSADVVLDILSENGLDVGQGTISANGHVFATFSNADGVLVIEFTSANGTVATTDLVNQVVHSVTYEDTSDQPVQDVSLVFSMDDGSGEANAYGSATVDVIVRPVNDPPVFGNLDADPTFVEDGPAVVLDSDAIISDPELDAAGDGLGDYSGATLTIARQNGADADDLFGFASADNFGVIGNTLVHGGRVFATFTLNDGTLSIQFTSERGITATSELVNSVLQSITYMNTSDTPPTSANIGYIFDDGSNASGAFAFGDITVHIEPTDDAPAVDNPDDPPAVWSDEVTHPFADMVLNDPDMRDPNAEYTITVTLNDPEKGDFSDANGLIEITPGVYQFTGTLGEIEDVIHGVVFDPSDSNLPFGEIDNATFTINIAGNGVSSEQTVTLELISDQPVPPDPHTTFDVDFPETVEPETPAYEDTAALINPVLTQALTPLDPFAAPMLDQTLTGFGLPVEQGSLFAPLGFDAREGLAVVTLKPHIPAFVAEDLLAQANRILEANLISDLDFDQLRKMEKAAQGSPANPPRSPDAARAPGPNPPPPGAPNQPAPGGPAR